MDEKNHGNVAIRDELSVNWVQNVQAVQAVQNVWNDLNYWNRWNSDQRWPITFAPWKLQAGRTGTSERK